MNDRRPFRWLALLWMGASLGATGCRETPSVTAPPPSATDGVRILCLGDSLTAGKDLEDPDQEAYPAVLERLLRASGRAATVYNAGVSGDTTANALARLDFSLQDKPDLVIVALGSNDTFQGKQLSNIEDNLTRIVNQCRLSGARVLLCGFKTFPNLGPSYAGQYTRLFDRVAKKTGVRLAPFLLEGVAGRADMNLADGIHPNARGHQRVADNLFPSVLKELAEIPRLGLDVRQRQWEQKVQGRS